MCLTCHFHLLLLTRNLILARKVCIILFEKIFKLLAVRKLGYAENVENKVTKVDIEPSLEPVPHDLTNYLRSSSRWSIPERHFNNTCLRNPSNHTLQWEYNTLYWNLIRRTLGFCLNRDRKVKCEWISNGYYSRSTYQWPLQERRWP